MNIKKRKPIRLILCLFLLVSTASGAMAQTNPFIDSVLAEEEASFGKSVYLVLVAAALLPESATVTEAVATLETFNWKIKRKAEDKPITLGEYALLLMKAFEDRGGLMYSLFQNTRYASYELAYRGWVQGNTSPYRSISGDEALALLSYMLSGQEGQNTEDKQLASSSKHEEVNIQ